MITVGVADNEGKGTMKIHCGKFINVDQKTERIKNVWNEKKWNDDPHLELSGRHT